ncbi:MAG: helix-turn-helix transcriptional regulator [Clostridia bacterium]|nr:helix-turn-helix transcriptional regulator [Clostridia bacterium]
MNSAEKLRKLRIEKGLTQKQLADELNISLSALSNYEDVKSPRIPRNDVLKIIADYFTVDIGYLIDDKINNTTRKNINLNKELGGLSDEAIENIRNLDYNVPLLNFFLENCNLNNLTDKIWEYICLREVESYINFFLTILQEPSETVINYLKANNDLYKTYLRNIELIFTTQLDIHLVSFDNSYNALKKCFNNIMTEIETNSEKEEEQKIEEFLEMIVDIKSKLLDYRDLKKYQAQKEITNLFELLDDGYKNKIILNENMLGLDSLYRIKEFIDKGEKYGGKRNNKK